MPKIRLLKKQGSYRYDIKYEAGKEYSVTNQIAYYLIHTEKVAETVNQAPVVIESQPESKLEVEVPLQVEVPPVSPLPPPPSKEFVMKKGFNVAMIKLGGIGDSLMLLAQALSVKKKYPDAIITLFILSEDCKDLLESQPAIDAVVVLNLNYESMVKSVLSKGFDIVYDNRYITKIYYKPVKGKEWMDKAVTDEAFKEYEPYFNQFPKSISQLAKLGKSAMDLMFDLVKLEKVELKVEYKTAPDVSVPYVTIHHATDISRMTKCWLISEWVKVISYLKNKGCRVIQIGKKFEDSIEGAENKIGQLTLEQTASLLSGAKFHIDTDSGLVQLAKGVGTRSIVLFGPTPVGFYGYSNNLNIISSADCRECWGGTDTWWQECPRGHGYPVKCMQMITSDMVIEVINKMEK